MAWPLPCGPCEGMIMSQFLMRLAFLKADVEKGLIPERTAANHVQAVVNLMGGYEVLTPRERLCLHNDYPLWHVSRDYYVTCSEKGRDFLEMLGGEVVMELARIKIIYHYCCRDSEEGGYMPQRYVVKLTTTESRCRIRKISGVIKVRYTMPVNLDRQTYINVTCC